MIDEAEGKRAALEKAVQGRDQLLKSREAVISKRDEEKKILIEKVQVLTDRYQALDSNFAKRTGLKEKAEREREIFRQDKISLEERLAEAKSQLKEVSENLEKERSKLAQLKDDSIHWDEEKVALVKMLSEEGTRAVSEFRTSQLYDDERYESYDAGRDFALRVVQRMIPSFDMGEFGRVATIIAAEEQAAAENEVTEATQAGGAPEMGPEVESVAPPSD